jgi:hypothetical protein
MAHDPFGRWKARSTTVARASLVGLLARNTHATILEARDVLREAYPFGPRKYHPYKVWLKTCKEELERIFGVEQKDFSGTLFAPATSLE